MLDVDQPVVTVSRTVDAEVTRFYGWLQLTDSSQSEENLLAAEFQPMLDAAAAEVAKQRTKSDENYPKTLTVNVVADDDVSQSHIAAPVIS